MEIKLSLRLMLLVSVIICTGCSVKENRDMCPCRLVLDFSAVDGAAAGRADLIVRSDDGFIITKELDPVDFLADMNLDVPRQKLSVAVWGGVRDMISSEEGIAIPSGSDCPPVYIHYSEVDADCELVRERVVMGKNHCRMTVNVNNINPGGMKVLICGNIDGYMADGTPSEGYFLYEMDMEDGVRGSVILPRQLDNSLIMEIVDDSGVMKRFLIGEYIAESGYDWTAFDLEDLTIDIDITFVGISLIIQGWDTVYRFDVEI